LGIMHYDDFDNVRELWKNVKYHFDFVEINSSSGSFVWLPPT
jgi:hypothetical protein